MGIPRVVKPQFRYQNLAKLCSAQHCQSAPTRGWVLEAVHLTLLLGLVFFQGSQTQISENSRSSHWTKFYAETTVIVPEYHDMALSC